MPNTNRKPPSDTTREDIVSSHIRHHRLWIAAITAGLSFLLVLSVIAVSGSIGGTLNTDSEPAEAARTDDKVDRFAGAFPIPNASGVGIREAAVLDSANDTVYVFGAVSCTAGEIVEVRINVTQQSTGAVATGHTATYCLGPNFVQSWIVIAEPTNLTKLEAGEAFVDAWARTQVNGETTDTIRWNRTVTVSETYPSDSSNSSATLMTTETVTDTGTAEPTAETTARETTASQSTNATRLPVRERTASGPASASERLALLSLLCHGSVPYGAPSLTRDHSSVETRTR